MAGEVSRRSGGLVLIDLAAVWAAELSCMAFGVGSGVLPISRRVAAAIDLAVGGSSLTAGDHASVSALADDAALAEMGPVAADIQLNVVGRSCGAAADADRIAECEPVGAGSQGETVAKSNSIFLAAARFGDLEHSASVGSRSNSAASDVDPRSGRLSGRFGRRECQSEGEQGSSSESE